MKKRNLVSLVIVGTLILVLLLGYFTCGIFVIQPIGAIPEGATVVYWRPGTILPFISSPDAICQKHVGYVNLLGRGMALGTAGKVVAERKIITLPYSRTLYLFSTGGYEYNGVETQQSRSDTTTSLFEDERLNRPSRSDFKILSLKGVWREYRGLVAIGEIKNEGSVAVGVEIEVIARDEDGVLVDSAQFWPNSISNILPGETCGIDYTITEDRSAKSIEAKVVRVNIWQ